MRKAHGVLEDESITAKGTVDQGDGLRTAKSGLPIQIRQLGLASLRGFQWSKDTNELGE